MRHNPRTDPPSLRHGRNFRIIDAPGAKPIFDYGDNRLLVVERLPNTDFIGQWAYVWIINGFT